MNYELFYPKAVREALQHDPPGVWMPEVPPGCVRLSAGYPSPALVPGLELGESVQRLLQEEGDLPLQYVGSSRMAALRNQVQHRLGQRGMPVDKNHLLLTSGGAQAIDLIAHTLIDTSTTIALEAPTYMEALEIFRNYTDSIIDVPMDGDGIRTDDLEELFAQRVHAGLPLPRLVYTIPSFHNPTGITMAFERRKRLLELAETFDFLIVEDDAYGELSFAEAPIPLKALDEAGRVIHVGSLSKVVAPGLRIGWVTGPESIISAIGWFKKDLDHSFVEATAATYMESIDWEERLSMLRDAYRDRRDVMIAALERYMPQGVTWNEPQGGFFVWIHVAGVDTASLLPKALEAGISYVPGRHFFHDPQDGIEFLRLSYSYVEPDLLVQGIKTLANLIRRRRQ